MRKHILFFFITTVMLGITGCAKNQRPIALSINVSQAIMPQEVTTENLIAKGINLLNESKYEDAKVTFEKAISMDKSNKDAYIEIKNKYIEKQRLDDACHFLKLSISNNIDTEYMKEQLSDIESQFEITKIDVRVFQSEAYELPRKIKAKINNEEKEVDVIWENNSVDTNKLGTTKYQGVIEPYGRRAELNLTVKKLGDKKITVLASNIYKQDGIWYIECDDIEFFRNYANGPNDMSASIEAKKDGKTASCDWYIRNTNKNIQTFIIDPDAALYICQHWLEIDYDNAAIVKKVSLNQFESLNINMTRYICYLYLDNNVVTKLVEQYTP